MDELLNGGYWLILAIPVVVLSVVWLLILAIKNFLYICEPNEVLIFSGGSRVASDGQKVGFRTVFGGRAWRIPILEKVDRMDMTLISVPMAINGAYSEGGIPLAMTAIANVKISNDPEVIGNAIERFLGRTREEIAGVAKETLEGHLRGVLATLTPEEVNEDRLKFAERLTAEADPDLRKLGLQLDTLKIQAVSDDRNYLDSIGRKRIAEIVRTAEVAESDAVRTAEESEAAALARGEVANTKAHAVVLQKQNELREITAELDAEARSEEERAEQAAAAARAEAEKELQALRAKLEGLRLQADVEIPAEMDRRVRELVAEGEAATIQAKGEAIATAVAMIHQAWRESGPDAMEMVTVQHLDKIFAEVTAAAKATQAKQVALLDGGDGSTVANYVDAYPATVSALLDRISNTFGVDISAVLRGDAPPQATTPDGERKSQPVEKSAA
ncbi:MAG: flotillin family protein [Myxococcota bacterium]